MTDETADWAAWLRANAPPGPLGRNMVCAAKEIEDLRISVTAFGAPWAVKYAEDRGYPHGHLHPHHFDLLARCGARMDAFVRHEETNDA